MGSGLIFADRQAKISPDPIFLMRRRIFLGLALTLATLIVIAGTGLLWGRSELRASLADDHTGATVFLARNAWHLERTEKDYPELRFLKVKEQAPS